MQKFQHSLKFTSAPMLHLLLSNLSNSAGKSIYKPLLCVVQREGMVTICSELCACSYSCCIRAKKKKKGSSQHQQHSAPVACHITGDIRAIFFPFGFFTFWTNDLPRVSLNIVRSKISQFRKISLLEKTFIFRVQVINWDFLSDFSLDKMSIEGWRLVFCYKYWRRKVLWI